MTTICVASSKGGAGKSTLAVHLGVAAQIAGEKVAIIDCDPQGSAIAWSEAREANEPYVIASSPADVAKALVDASSEGCSVVIIDTQPRASASLGNVIQRSNFTLIPVQPTPFDLATGEVTSRIAGAAGTPFAFILSRCPARSPDVPLARTFLEQYGTVVDATIGERRIYARSLQTGKSCQEYEPSSDAAVEIADAWSEIARRANVVSSSLAEG